MVQNWQINIDNIIIMLEHIIFKITFIFCSEPSPLKCILALDLKPTHEILLVFKLFSSYNRCHELTNVVPQKIVFSFKGLQTDAIWRSISVN